MESETKTKKPLVHIKYEDGEYLVMVSHDFLYSDELRRVQRDISEYSVFAKASVDDEIGKSSGRKTPSIQNILATIKILDEAGVAYRLSTQVNADLAAASATEERSRATESHIDAPENKRGFRLYGYQKAGTEFLLEINEERGVLLADETGLGKTVQTLAYILNSPDVKKILVVCPKTVKENWKREIRTWMFLAKGIDERFMEDSAIGPVLKKDFITMPESKPRKGIRGTFAIVNHDRLRSSHLVNAIKEWEPDLIVVDECHAFKNSSAQRTQAFLSLDADRRIALSATPLDKVQHMWPIMFWLAPGRFPNRYAFKRGYEDDPIKLGTDLRKLHLMLRRTKISCKVDLPPRINMIEEQEAPKEVVEMYREFVPGIDLSKAKGSGLSEKELNEMTGRLKAAMGDEELFAKTQEEVERRFDQAMGSLQEVTKIPFSSIAKAMSMIESTKVDWVADMIESALVDQPKVVVFAHHRDTVTRIWNKLKKHNPLMINGDLTAEERNKRALEFQHDPERKVIIGTTGSIKEGVNLQAASHSIIVTIPWNYSTFDQLRGRTHRLGSNRPCVYQMPIYKGTIDAAIAQIYAQKSRVFEDVLG